MRSHLFVCTPCPDSLFKVNPVILLFLNTAVLVIPMNLILTDCSGMTFDLYHLIKLQLSN